MRVALIHALKHSIPASDDAFARLWPQATVQNLLDDSLPRDFVREGGLTAALDERIFSLAKYARDSGAQAILFTGGAFGPSIDRCKSALTPIPVMKPNEALIKRACAMGRRIGVVATFAPLLHSMTREFPSGVEVVPSFVEGAFAALEGGDLDEHNRLIAIAVSDLRTCDVVVLAQFSSAHAAKQARAAICKPVVTAPDSAVLELRKLLDGVSDESSAA